jgi:Integrase core domain
VLWSLAYLVVRRLFELMMLCCRSPRSKELEILVLRHELSILRRHARRPQLREADRLFRRECLDRILIVNRRHLERVLRAYTGHYNRHRPHRSLALQPPDQPPAMLVRAHTIHIHKREVLGGLINEYKAAA